MQSAARSPSVLDVKPVQTVLPMAVQLQQMSRETGESPLTIAQSYLRLAFGPGRVSFRDFGRLRLFDPVFHQGAPLDAYVGQRKNRDLCVTANYRHDWLGLVADKIAACSYLAAHDLPTIPFTAIYTPGLQNGSARILHDRAALETFLLDPAAYPLFGKPVDGFQSLGSVALTSVGPGRTLTVAGGATIGIDDLTADIEAHFTSGYCFQGLVRPHPAIAKLCGARLACVRLVTALYDDGPRILRGALKIPAGANSADNYWRAGNLLAQIDLQSGRVLRTVSGVGLATHEHTRHPDTGEALFGFEYPDWAQMRALALQGATLMRHVPLIGWDMAATDRGVVIVEMNATPDLFLVQFADRRGALDSNFKAFMALQARHAGRHLKKMKAGLRQL